MYSIEELFTSNEEMSDSESILKALSKQEENFYLIDDYFREIPASFSEGVFPVDANARQLIAKWCIRVIEAFNCSKEIAAITMSCLDRFVSTESGKSALFNRSEYQLAALAALYSSVKIHNPMAFSSQLMAQMSRNDYTKDEIEAMERRMLCAIQWRVNPPTALEFVRIYLDMSTTWNWLDMPEQDAVMELVAHQVDLSIIDYELSTSKASHIAIASLLNAIKSISSSDSTLYQSISDINTIFCDVDQRPLKKLQQKLYQGMVEQNNVKTKAISEPMRVRSVSVKSDSSTESPRSVYKYDAQII